MSSLELHLTSDLDRKLREQAAELGIAPETLAADLLRRALPTATESGSPDRAHARMLSRLVHELRTPLGTVLMLGELLSEQSDLPERPARYARTIYQAAADVLHLVNEVGELARIDGDRLELFLGEVDLGPLLGKLQVQWLQVAAEREKELDLSIVNGLPTLRTDRKRLCQVLDTLVHAALDATTGLVSVTVEPSPDQLAFRVRDHGPPLPRPTPAAIFEPFLEPDVRNARRFGGASLRLPVAARLAAYLGGSLSVERPDDDDGASLVLRLPGRPERATNDE